MEIDTHILSLTMEFERQNIIITEWETERAKNARDKKWKKRKARGKRMKSERRRNNNIPNSKLEKDNSSNPNILSSSDSPATVPTIIIDSEVLLFFFCLVRDMVYS